MKNNNLRITKKYRKTKKGGKLRVLSDYKKNRLIKNMTKQSFEKRFMDTIEPLQKNPTANKSKNIGGRKTRKTRK